MFLDSSKPLPSVEEVKSASAAVSSTPIVHPASSKPHTVPKEYKKKSKKD